MATQGNRRLEMCIELMCCQRLECEENLLAHKGQSQEDGVLGWQAELGEDSELDSKHQQLWGNHLKDLLRE